MWKHLADVAGPDADADTISDADANANAYAYANADADANPDADANAHTVAESRRVWHHDHSDTESGAVDGSRRRGM